MVLVTSVSMVGWGPERCLGLVCTANREVMPNVGFGGQGGGYKGLQKKVGFLMKVVGFLVFDNLKVMSMGVMVEDVGEGARFYDFPQTEPKESNPVLFNSFFCAFSLCTAFSSFFRPVASLS